MDFSDVFKGIVMNSGLLAIALTTLLLTSCSDDIENHYSNYDRMKVSDSYKKGWIPDFIPKSASNIHERHNLDNNMVWMRFECDTSDLRRLTEVLELADENERRIILSDFSLPNTITCYHLSRKEIIAVNREVGTIYYLRTGY